MKDEPMCPICSETDGSHNIKICDACKSILMPELAEDEFHYDGHPGDYYGFIEFGGQLY